MLFLVGWSEGGKRQQAVTPLVPHRGAAFVWLVRQRPWLLADPESVTVELYRPLAFVQR